MSKSLLIIGFVWPEPNSSAAGSRMLQLIDFFKTKNYTITFASAAQKSEKTFDLNAIGVAQQVIQLNHSSFDDFIEKLAPNIVLFDRFMIEEQYGWRVSQYCPQAIKILDSEDLHCLRKGRHEALKNNINFTDEHLFNTIAKREIASIFRCDLTLIISEFEMELLMSKFKMPKSLLCYLPFMLDELKAEYINQLPSFANRQHCVTIGNFLHAPNLDGVKYLKTKIWPLVRQQLPSLEMHIYGAYASQHALQLNSKKEGFLVKGYAKNANEVMQQAKLCIAALRFGAGLKGKLIDAMQNGTPCIMTSVAAEGMFGDNAVNGEIEDNPALIAKAIVNLYNNEGSFNTSAKNGFSIINTRFLKSHFYEKFEKVLVSLEENYIQERQSNFVGQMLNHHFLQSTKYMSKWIEEKEKLTN